MPLSKISSPFQTANANVYSTSSGNTVIIKAGSRNAIYANTISTSTGVALGLANTPSPWQGPFTVIENLGSTYQSAIGFQSNALAMKMFCNAYYNGTNYTKPFMGSSAYIGVQDGKMSAGGIANGASGSTADIIDFLSVSLANTVALQGATMKTGTGITFPSTANVSDDPNTLDDYEEGTWTPQHDDGTSMSINGTCGYVKIGSQVYAYFDCSASKSTSYINNLPFVALYHGATTNYAWYSGYNNISGKPVVCGHLNSASSRLNFYDNQSNYSITSGNRIIGAVIYRTAS